jgi:ankyrin repeat protein
LIEEGAAVNVNNKCNGMQWNAMECNGMPLYEATRNWHLAVVQVFLKTDADVNVRYSDNQMPLHWMTKYGYLVIVKELLVSGANPSAKNKDGKTLLDVAKTEEV